MFCLICTDKPDSVALRLANRDAHIAYVLGSPAVRCAGPFTAEDGETMIGTLIMLDVATRAEAETWVTNDPYAQAGLFASVDVRRWSHLLGGLPDPQAPDTGEVK